MNQSEKNNKKKLLIGAHISIAGNIGDAFKRGETIGCTAIQLFVKNNRQWAAPLLTDENILTFKTESQKSNISLVVAHASYLINICSSNNETARKSFDALLDEFSRCALLDIPYLVLHPGSGSKDDSSRFKKIALAIDKVFEKVPGKSMILLENMAGQGNCIGRTFEELAEIIHHINNKKRVGICFDTCHAFAGGYELQTESTYMNTWDDFNKTLGINNLKVIHINDSKKDFNSHVDRHEHIGLGTLGLEPFRFIMNDERLFSIPKILETPKKSADDDIRNLQTLIRLLSPDRKKEFDILSE